MARNRKLVPKIATLVAISMASTVFAIANPSLAAAGTPTLDHTSSIEFSGSSPFWDPNGNGVADPGDDIGGGVSDGFDGIRHYVRTGDRTSYKLEYNVNDQDADDLVLKASLIEVDAAGNPTGNPIAEGVTFPELPPACQGGSAIAADGHSVECVIGSVPSGTTAFVTIQVEADNSIPNGYRYAIVYEVCERADDGSVEVTTGPLQGESVTVSSAPRYDLWKRRAHNRGPFPMPAGGPGTEGDVGVVIQYAVGVLAGDGDARGLSMLAEYDEDVNGSGSIDNVVTITDDIAPISGGAGPYGTPAGSYLFNFGNLGDGCGSNYGTDARGELNVWGDQPRGQIGHDGGTLANATPDSGVWTCSQSGTTITMDITGADFRGQSFPTASANNAAMSADQKWFSSGWFAVWIPIDAIEDGPDGVPGTADDGEYLSSDTLGTFDGNDIWGASNYGGGTEPVVDDADLGHRQNGLQFTLEEKGVGWDKEFRKSIPGDWGGVWNGWGEAPSNATSRDSGDGQAMNGTEWATYLTTINESFQSRTSFQQCDAIDNSTYQIAPDRNGFIWVGWMDGNSVDTTYPTSLDTWDSGFSGRAINPDQHVIIEFGTGLNGGVAGNWADGNFAVPSDPATWGGLDHWQRPGWNLMDDATCGDGDSANGWFELPNPYDPADLPAGVDLTDITKFRVRIDHPDADPAGTWQERSVLAAGQRINVAVHHVAYDNTIFNNSNNPNDPYPTILANMAFDSYTNKNDTLFTRDVFFDPLAYSSISTGDRLIATKAQVRIDKEFVEKTLGSGPNFLGGDPVTWTLSPTVASLTDIASDPAEDVRVVDVFPQPYLEYAPGSASPAQFTDLTSGDVHPVYFCVVAPCDKDTPSHWVDVEPADPATVLGLMWDLGEVPLGAPLPQLTYVTYTSIDTPTNTDIPNVATIYSPSDNASEDRRSDETGIKVIQLGSFAVSKRVNTPIIFTDEIIEWELRYANVSAVDVSWYDLIDILPHNDQEVVADPLLFPSDYQGDLELLSVTPDGGNVASVTYYSAAAPTAIVENASDASNVLGAGSIWCSDDAGAVAGTPALGTAGCPAADLSDATAFRITGDTLVGPPTPSGIQIVTVRAQTVGNDPIDFYANEYAVKLPDSVLTLPVKSNEVYTRVWGGSIGDLVFVDENRNGVFDTGDTPMPGVDVTLIDVTNGNVVLDTATTDGDGRYVFDFIERPGDFKVQVDSSNFATVTDPLFAHEVTIGAAADPDVDRNENVDHDAAVALPTNGHESGVLTLGVGTEPSSEDVLSKDVSGAVDTDTNLSVDFGYYLPTAEITIEKKVEDPDNPDTFVESITIGSATTVNFQIVVTNTGEVALEDVTVSDPNFAACDNATIGDLAPSASVTYECSGTATNSLNPNTASATGTPADGRDDVSDSDTAAVAISGVAIIKTVADPDSSSYVDDAEYAIGSDVTFQIIVRNTGSDPVTDAAVADPSYPACDRTSAELGITASTPLAPGGSVTYTCTVANVTDGLTNTATVSATTATGATPSISDTANVETYGLSITNTVYDPLTEGEVELAEFEPGDEATFTFTITNDGSTDLTGVEFVNDLYPDCDTTIGDLAAGESVEITCDVTINSAGTNTGSVDGDTPDGNNPTASDTSAVEVYAIDIAKTVLDPVSGSQVELAEIAVGETATFEFVVSNNGSVDLTNVELADDLYPECSVSIGVLEANDSTTLTCDVVITDGGTNTASADGLTPDGNNPSAADTAAVESYGVSITNTVFDPITGMEAELGQFEVGETATFTFTITNDGSTDLTDVELVNDLYPDCDVTIGELAAGESVEITCDVVITDTGTNTATVSGSTPEGNEPTADDTSAVEARGIELVKEVWDTETGQWVDAATVVDGGNVIYRYTVTNIGDVDLSSIDVTDLDVPECGSDEAGVTVPTLAPDETFSYECPTIHEGGPITGDASVVGQDPNGNPVSDDDPAGVTVAGPSIDILVEVWDPVSETWVDESVSFADGQDVEFRVTITNTGDVDLFDVTITNPLLAECADVVSSLEVGGAVSYECSTTISESTGDLLLEGTVEAHPDCDLFYPTADAPNSLALGDCPSVSDTDDATATYNPGSIVGTVFNDADGDGIVDSGETAIGGATVTITDADGNVVGTTTTAADGSYTFDGLPPGDYTVTVTPPSGVTLPSGYEPVVATVNGGQETLVNQSAAAVPATLALTGIDADQLAAFAVALITVGWAMVLWTRREDEAAVVVD